MRKIYILFFVLVSSLLVAQNYDAPKNNFKTLNAADIPVDYVTGIPDIGIDLFNVPTINPNFSLNFRLQYDLYSNSSKYFSTNEFGDTWRLSVSPKISRNSYVKLELADVNMSDEMYYLNDETNSNRSNSDLFTYEIFGLTGIFKLKRDGLTLTSEIIEQNNYAKIDIIYTAEEVEFGVKFTIKSFVISDKNGFEYNFSDFDEYSITGDDEIKKVNFYLTKVNDKNKKTLCEYFYQESFERVSSLQTLFIYKSTKKVNSIKIPAIGVVDFTKINVEQDQITLKNAKNEILKKIDLNYIEPSVTLKEGFWQKKLLRTLIFWSNDNLNKQTFKFEYISRQLLNPDVNSLGFVIRKDPCFNDNFNANKENLYYDNWVLKKITYPTGGTVFYEFEPNDFYIGSLRINIEEYKKNNSKNFNIVDLPLVHDPINNRYLLEDPLLQNSDNFVYFNYSGNFYQNNQPFLPDLENGSGGIGNSSSIFPSLRIYAYFKNSNFNPNLGTLFEVMTQSETTCSLGSKFSTIENKYSLVYDKNQLNSYTSIVAKAIIYNTENIQKYLYGNGLRVKTITTFDTDIKINKFLNGSYTEIPTSEVEFNYRKFDDPNSSSGYTKFRIGVNNYDISRFNDYSDVILYKNVSVKTKGLGEMQFTFDEPNPSFAENSNIFPENVYIKKLPYKIVKKDENGNTIEENIFTRTFKEFNPSGTGINKQPIVTFEKVVNKTYVDVVGDATPLELVTESRFDTISRNIISKKIINPVLNETFEEQYTYVKYNNSYLPKTVTKFKNGIALNRSENFYLGKKCGKTGLRTNIYYNLANSQIAKSNLPLEIENEYTNYSCEGKLLEYKTKDGVYVSQIWGYNGAFVIAELHNIRYTEINEQLLNSLIAASNLTNTSYNENNIRGIVNQLRDAHPNVQIKSYTFNPLIGITSLTDVNGRNEFYEYDSFNRLYRIKDHNLLILKEYNYNYKNQ
nr:hypothetical protein [uncultured Flavobacterium sp.]